MSRSSGKFFQAVPSRRALQVAHLSTFHEVNALVVAPADRSNHGWRH